MAFKRKKKELETAPVPPEEQPDETEMVESQVKEKQNLKIDKETAKRLKELTSEFNKNYNGIVPPESLQAESLKINLLFAIYGEMVRQREILEQIMDEE